MKAFLPRTISSLIGSLLRLRDVLLLEGLIQLIDFAVVEMDELLFLGFEREFLVGMEFLQKSVDTALGVENGAADFRLEQGLGALADPGELTRSPLGAGPTGSASSFPAIEKSWTATRSFFQAPDSCA